MPVSTTVAPFKYKAQVTNIVGVAAGATATVTLQPVYRINNISIEATITLPAAGNGVKTVPVPSQVITSYIFKVGGKPQRVRFAAHVWGAQGLNSLWDVNYGGSVVYTQAGNANLSIVPVPIGSAADVAQQALLTANTATTATFQLPIEFSEPFRKEYAVVEAMALPQSRKDGSSIGTCTLDVNLANTANATGIGLKAYWEYDTLVADTGAVISFAKEYLYNVQYAAAGNIECALQLPNRDQLMSVSLLTATDNISNIQLKQGATVLRDISFVRNAEELIRKDYNPNAIVANRFDVELDDGDNPNSAPVLDPSQPLSLLATLATANDAGKTIYILARYWGPLD